MHEGALALETLDVTLTGEQKTLILPLVDESQPLGRRISALNGHFALPGLAPAARLAEIIADQVMWPQSWTRACAIYAVGKLAHLDLVDVITEVSISTDEPVRETARWALAMLESRTNEQPRLLCAAAQEDRSAYTVITT